MQALSSCGERGLLFIAVRGLLIAVASPVAEHGPLECRLHSCGARALLLRGMWDLPGPGLEPVSPAMAGGFLTSAPPGKSPRLTFFKVMFETGVLHHRYALTLQRQMALAMLIFLKKLRYRDFPGGPVVRTLCCHHRGPGVLPLVRKLGSRMPRSMAKINK